jgi:hypothetical protein
MWNRRAMLLRVSGLYALSLISFGLLGAAPARAEALAAPALHWVRAAGAESCPAARPIAEQVEALVGAPLVRTAEAEHTIEAISERKASGFRVRVRLFARAGQVLGERSLETREACAALAAPAAFVIAVMIDPEVVAHGLPPALLSVLGEDAPEVRLLEELERTPPRPLALAPEAPTPAPLAPKAQVRGVRADTRFRGLLGLGTSLFAGPEPGLVGHALGALFVRPWLSLAASLWGGGELRMQRSHEAAFRLSMAGFAGLLCGASPGARRLQLTGCLGPSLRLRHARGHGLGRDQSTTLLSGSASALLTGRVRLRGAWGFAATLSADLGFTRPRLVYADAAGMRYTAHRFGWVDLLVSLGPSYEF